MPTISLTDVATIIALEREIPEFDAPIPSAEFDRRLAGRRTLALIARQDAEIAGFLIGYERDPATFYNWLTGVLPRFRGRGIGTSLMVACEKFARSSGYGSIAIATKERYATMLALLRSMGYRVTGGDGDKIFLARSLLDPFVPDNAAPA